MNKILIVFAHPAFQKSKVNKVLLEMVSNERGVTINSLYDRYPDFYIDVIAEQQLLLEHDIIIWQHPFFWYSGPSLLKEWFDLVLQHGFAYGEKGLKLQGKKAMSVVTTGGRQEVYCAEGRNHFTVNEFLVPYQQSANLCHMEYLPPFVVYGTYSIKPEEVLNEALKFKKVICALRDNQIGDTTLAKTDYLNQLTL